ncbi:fimbrial protein [Pseudomonas sp. M30-35]|uniref:fimbrial protein n=1 Tax=Pseudomonas sp. M30-35 TaxID=1981174 RepID=UPI000B3C8A54|nr:type 1 fimbrial protein [Pseudomonas sp. M30-35]ARU88918.1 hypothetical protein B9K09_13495 [Pseudomonas sp. M30-35]
MVRSICGMFLLLCSLQAYADFGSTPCPFNDIASTYSYFGDPALANVGDVIGMFDIDITVTGCSQSLTDLIIYRLGAQPVDPLANSPRMCETTVYGVGLRSAGESCASYYPGNYSTGPGVGDLRPIPIGSRVSVVSKSFELVKTGEIPVGPSQLSLKNSTLSVVGLDVFVGGGNSATFQLSQLGAIPPGEIIGTECSLATTNINVPFGDISGVGATESFDVVFDSCTDQLDATGYNNSVSLAFSSQRIKPDGSALLNCSDADCAKGIQIELQNKDNTPISLTAPYRLSSNTPVFGPNGLTYTFNAQIKENPGEAMDGGKIDTQLVFETIVE